MKQPDSLLLAVHANSSQFSVENGVLVISAAGRESLVETMQGRIAEQGTDIDVTLNELADDLTVRMQQLKILSRKSAERSSVNALASSILLQAVQAKYQDALTKRAA